MKPRTMGRRRSGAYFVPKRPKGEWNAGLWVVAIILGALAVVVRIALLAHR